MMTLTEWKEVKEFDYYTFVNYLNKKYGKVNGNYFDIKKDGTLRRGKAGVKGHYIHHVKEYEVADLCQKAVAAQNPIEYQYSKNLVEADALEHFYLHILISEEFDKTDDFRVGEGGVIWIATTINQKIKKGELSTEDYKVFLKLVNRYCASSFIRQKHNMQPEDLLVKLLGGNTNKKDYEAYLDTAKDTKLFNWNISAFSELQTYLKTNRTAGLVICTGGGKTTTALEYLRVHDAKALIIGPSNTIGGNEKDGTGWMGNADQRRFGYDYTNYQSFQNNYKDIDYSKYDVIICDEMHHTEAPRWGEGLQFVLDNTNLKIIGLTATPSNDQKHGIDKYFGGRLCKGLNLAEGIRNNNIHAFSYISAIYKLDRGLFDKTEAGRQLLGRLDIELNKNPIDKILKDNMPKSTRKIIVFVQEKDMFDEARETLIRYNPKYATEEYARTIYSGLDQKYIEDAKNWFNTTNDHDVVLFTINMANEGAHFDGINTLIMFRKTNSATLYLQQLGRIVVTSNKPDPDGIVFDFTNNAQTLINRQQIVVKKVKEVKAALEEELSEDALEDMDTELSLSEKEDNELIKDIQNACKEKAESLKNNIGKVIIYKDYTEDCAATLAALHDAQQKTNRDAQIFVELEDALMSDEEFLSLWKDLKVSASGRLLISTKHSSSYKKKVNGKPKDKDTDEKEVKQVVRASDAEKLATVFKLIVRRAFSFGAIDFSDDIKVGVTIVNQQVFENICRQVGIADSDIILKAMNNLAKLTFIIANSID